MSKKVVFICSVAAILIAGAASVGFLPKSWASVVTFVEFFVGFGSGYMFKSYANKEVFKSYEDEIASLEKAQLALKAEVEKAKTLVKKSNKKATAQNTQNNK